MGTAASEATLHSIWLVRFPPVANWLRRHARDNGIGIAEKHYAAIFRIFKRLHGRNEYSGGTGTGLTIAQKIVERHGGRLWLDSVVGEGTTFYFTLAPEPKEGQSDVR